MNSEVLIIGGGVIGLSIARELHKNGVHRITIAERGKLGGEASYAAAGMLAPNAECEKIDDFYNFCSMSARLYPQFAAELLEETGIDIQLNRTGTLYLALSESDSAELRNRLACHQAAGFRTQLLTGQEIAAREPAVSPEVREGLLLPDDWQVENRLLLAALRAYAETAGIDIRENTEVTDLIIEGGSVRAAATSAGPLRADSIVIATGAWTSFIKVGGAVTEIDVKPIRGQMLAFGPSVALKHVIYSHRGYLVPRADGRILAGATVEDAGFDKALDDAAMQQLAIAAAEIVPGLADAEVVEEWCGLRPFAADGLPIIGEMAGIKGLFVATGHFRNGILLAPATARAAAEFLTAGKIPDGLSLFRPGRKNAAGVTA